MVSGDSSESSPIPVDRTGDSHQGGWGEATFRELYERHATEILRYAIRCTGRREIAEEITSEAFLKMYQQRDRIDPARAAAWLTTNVKNLAIDHWRRVQTEKKHQPAAERIDARRPDDWEEMLAHPQLKAEHRVCLTLHYVHGMERKEITSYTGLTDNQVKNCLQYGLKLLRAAFGMKE